MSNSLYVGAYWSARAEPVDACTARATRCLAGLSASDSLLQSWFLKASRRTASRAPIDPDVELAELLLRGRNHRENDNTPIEDLGYSLGLWNGDADDPTSLTIRCGVAKTIPGESNAVVLNLPPKSERCRHLYGPGGAASLLEVLVESWEPDWATVTSNASREALGSRGGAVLGWFTYLSARRGHVPALPTPFRAQTNASGTIVTTNSETPPDPALLEQLEQLLGAQLMRPSG